ncbi:MAG TPA: nuclear transport factor 2 family protein [Mycobacteriales bacterium]|nr:nuclear transport factor 2 family protein [Mycobacteriales bacterium]
MTDVEDVTEANAEFYTAIESGDIDRIEALWDDHDDLVCVHPGWPPLSGRSRVLRSWAVIMANTAYIQFFLTDVDVAVTGDVAVVACQHSLLAGSTEAEGEFGETATVVATNVFRRRPQGWRLWAHHASPVMSASEDGETA